MTPYIKNVGRNYQWASPAYIGTMFCDGKDYLGIIFWYNDLIDQKREAEALNKK